MLNAKDRGVLNAGERGVRGGVLLKIAKRPERLKDLKDLKDLKHPKYLKDLKLLKDLSTFFLGIEHPPSLALSSLPSLASSTPTPFGVI